MTPLRTARPLVRTRSGPQGGQCHQPKQGQAVGALHRVMINTDSDVSIGAVLTVEVLHGYA